MQNVSSSFLNNDENVMRINKTMIPKQRKVREWDAAPILEKIKSLTTMRSNSQNILDMYYLVPYFPMYLFILVSSQNFAITAFFPILLSAFIRIFN